MRVKQKQNWFNRNEMVYQQLEHLSMTLLKLANNYLHKNPNVAEYSTKILQAERERKELSGIVKLRKNVLKS